MTQIQDCSAESELADLRSKEHAWLVLSTVTLAVALYLGYVAVDSLDHGQFLAGLVSAAMTSFSLVLTARWLIMLALTLRDIQDLDQKEES